MYFINKPFQLHKSYTTGYIWWYLVEIGLNHKGTKIHDQILEGGTYNPLYTDTQYNNKIRRYNDNLTVTKPLLIPCSAE